MSDIRFNQWLHNSGTGGVSQVDGGHVGIGTTNPLIPVGAGVTAILNVGVVTANSYYGDGSNLSGIVGGGTSLSFNDNIGAYFGNSQDLKIHHDGNHSYIDDQGTGNLRFRSGTLEILNLAGNKTSAIFSSGGGQTLNFNNSTKFVTTNTGIVATGILTSTSRLSVGNNTTNAVDLEFGTNRGSAGDTLANINWKWNNTYVAQIRGMAGSDTTNKDDAHLNFYTASAGSLVERLRITSGGAIGINTSSPQQSHHPSIHLHGSQNDDARIAITTPNKPSGRIGYYGLSDRFGIDVHNGFEIRDIADSYATRLLIDSSGNLNIGSVGRFDASGLVKSAHGTESAPSHTFLNDPDNGMYRPTTNTLGFVTGGTERLRILSGGKIQLSSATDNIFHTSSNSSRLRLFGGSNESVSNGAVLTLHGISHSNGNYADLAAGTSGHIQFRVGTSEKLRITSSGQLLVNATTINAGGAAPKMAIDVGDSNLHGIIIQAGGGESNGDLAGIAFGQGNTGDIARPKAAIAHNRSSSYGIGDLCFYVDGAGDNNAVSSGDERLRITADGNAVFTDKDSGHIGGGFYSRTKSVAGNTTINFMRFTLTHGALAGSIYATASNNAYSISKSYSYAVQYGDGGNVNIQSDSGPMGGVDYIVSCSTSASTHTFRVQNVGSATIEVNLTIIVGCANQDITYTEL